jgi:hypothetical protein
MIQKKINHLLRAHLPYRTCASIFLLLALPASGNYELHDFGLGAGGVGVAESGAYSMHALSGEISGERGSGAAYSLGPGIQFTRQSNVPAAPTFSNTENHYNRLPFILNTGGNPSDAVFAIAISTDNFLTTNFVQADGTIGPTEIFQSYADWGGSAGEFVVGLTNNTTYTIKIKAMHTRATETEYSATASATTATPSLAFDIDIAASNSETGPPYAVSFGNLAVASVNTAPDKIWLDLTTNAVGGGFIYGYTQGAGLSSANAAYTIVSATTNLADALEGYGVRAESTTQSSGGPLVAVSPYDGSAESVGVLNATPRTLINSSHQPVTNGRAAFLVKAKASGLTPIANDYTDVVTVVASGSF